MRGKSHSALGEAARRALLGALVALASTSALPARASGDEPGEAGAVATEPSPVVNEGAPAPIPLDRLLELPRGFELPPAAQHGGQGESVWRRRFAEARAGVETSRATLESSKAELAELAQSSDAWTVAPPVGAPAMTNEAPLSYALRQRINREEAGLQDAERRLRDLEVEANLAGVPDEWRR